MRWLWCSRADIFCSSDLLFAEKIEVRFLWRSFDVLARVGLWWTWVQLFESDFQFPVADSISRKHQLMSCMKLCHEAELCCFWKGTHFWWLFLFDSYHWALWKSSRIQAFLELWVCLEKQFNKSQSIGTVLSRLPMLQFPLFSFCCSSDNLECFFCEESQVFWEFYAGEVAQTIEPCSMIGRIHMRYVSKRTSLSAPQSYPFNIFHKF